MSYKNQSKYLRKIIEPPEMIHDKNFNLVIILLALITIMKQNFGKLINIYSLFFDILVKLIAKMSEQPQWRKTMSRSHSKDSRRSIKSSSRYNPKRQQGECQKFHNETVSRIHQSRIQSEQIQRSRVKQRSEGGRQSYTPSKGHSASSPNILVKAISQEKQLGNKYPQASSNPAESRRKINHIVKKPDGNIFEELKRLKREFSEFRSKIFSELKRQQKLIVDMFEQAMRNMKNDFKPQENFVKLPQQCLINPPELEKLTNNSLTKNETMKKNASQSTFRQQKIQNKQIPTEKHHRIESNLFDKFLKAVHSLKKQMKQMSEINHLSHKIKTPPNKQQIDPEKQTLSNNKNPTLQQLVSKQCD